MIELNQMLNDELFWFINTLEDEYKKPYIDQLLPNMYMWNRSEHKIEGNTIRIWKKKVNDCVFSKSSRHQLSTLNGRWALKSQKEEKKIS